MCMTDTQIYFKDMIIEQREMVELLGQEIILGCDRFDVDDFKKWLERERCDKQALRAETEAYIRKMWPAPEAEQCGAWSEPFLQEQLDMWFNS